MTDQRSNTNDHDLLLSMKAEFGTKLDRVINDVAELKNNFASRVDSLETGKADKREFNEMRTDVKWLQRIAYGGLGILAAIQFYFHFIRTG